MTMLYKPGTMFTLQDGKTVDYILTDDVDAAKADGWMTLDELLTEPKTKGK